MSLQKLIEEQLKQFVEKGADLEHDRWARWQKHLFSKCTPHKILSRSAKTNQEEEIETGNLVIHRELVERWTRQIDTPYFELSEAEKESDREETRNYIPVLVEAMINICKKTKYKNPIDETKRMFNYPLDLIISQLQTLKK